MNWEGVTDGRMDSLNPFGRGPMYFDKDGQPITMRRWMTLLSDIVTDADGNVVSDTLSDYALIGEQEFEGGVRVSTVWLGLNDTIWLDLNGVLPGNAQRIFETMIFGPEGYPYNNAYMRYATEPEAAAGHQRTCDDIEAGRRPWFCRGDDDE